MSRASVRTFVMLLEGYTRVGGGGVGGECDPYTKPPHLSANITLVETLVRVDHGSANTNLCEDMT